MFSSDELEFHFDDVGDIIGEEGILTGKDEDEPFGFGLGGGDIDGDGVQLRERRGKGKS